MGARSDGSINIDTKIDTDGFNQGIAKMSSSMGGALKGLLSGLTGVAAVALIIVAIIAAIGAAIVIAAATGVRFFISMINEMQNAVIRTSAYGQEIAQIEKLFADVKGAAYAAFSPIVEFALPYIKLVVSWLVNVLNTISMIVAVLLGQKTVMQYIEGSASSAATATGQLADNTHKAGQAAKGALAAFDQINVLAQKTSDTTGGGQTRTPGYGMVSVPIDPEIAKQVADVEAFFSRCWNAIRLGAMLLWSNIQLDAKAAWDWVLGVWSVVAPWFQINVTDHVVAFFTTAWAWVSQAAIDAWTWISATWATVSSWFQLNVIDPVVASFTAFWTFVGILVHDAWAVIIFYWSAVAGWFYNTVIAPLVGMWSTGWNNIKALFMVSWETIKVVWGIVASWFQLNVIDPWKKYFTIALDWLTDKFTTVFNGIGSIAKGVVNIVIDLINGMLRGIQTAINAIISGANNVGHIVPGWKVIPSVSFAKIPQLATGAVIPPNAAFAAILGDQRSGKNIEAPESLIRSLFNESLDAKLGSQQITINFAGSLGSLVRELKPFIDKENVRHGANLIIGATG
jgi:hypothetical protein